MGQPYIGEVRQFGFGFAPRGWALCNGQLLAIQQNQALFSILGTTYGGDGIRTFALPNLQGRVAAHRGSTLALGTVLGEETHTLLSTEMPQHTHQLYGSSDTASSVGPGNNMLATVTATQNVYASAPAGNTLVALAAATVGQSGSTQPHENRQPYLVTSFCIALQGIFPSRN